MSFSWGIYEKEEQWVRRERENERQAMYIKNMQEMNHKLMAERHDYNHHISCIYGLLEMNELDELKKYLKKLVFDMEEVNSIAIVDNPSISALLNFKLTFAKEKNIKLAINVNIPRYLNIDSKDISVILGNAIDNAIEACQSLEDKLISVYIYMDKEYLIIKIANTMKEKSVKINEMYKTTKQLSKEHGFGIENIKYVVNKYDGLLKIEEENNMFKLNIAIRDCGY